MKASKKQETHTMHTMPGASGQVGTELSLSLAKDHKQALRPVSRNPVRVKADDMLHPPHPRCATPQRILDSTPQ